MEKYLLSIMKNKFLNVALFLLLSVPDRSACQPFPDTVSEGEGETEDTERKPVTSNITKNVCENGIL